MIYLLEHNMLWALAAAASGAAFTWVLVVRKVVFPVLGRGSGDSGDGHGADHGGNSGG
ncbi:MAG: hypothetical protein ACRCYQ_16880 [Nocardioides sp.]